MSPSSRTSAMADRFHVRGAYLDETIRLWRHLWSGSTEPFHGPLPPARRLRVRAAPGPGATADRRRRPRGAALRRAGTLADGYHSSATSPAPTPRASRSSPMPPRQPDARRRRCRPGCASSSIRPPRPIRLRPARRSRDHGRRDPGLGRDRRHSPRTLFRDDGCGGARRACRALRPRRRATRLSPRSAIVEAG